MTSKKMKGTTSYNNYVDDQVLCNILSRLPLKSLMRFRCVCKSWQSLIDKDQWLTNLHHSRQLKENPRLSYLINKDLSKDPCLLITNLLMAFPRDESIEFQSYCTDDLCMDTNHKEITTATTTMQAVWNKDLLVCEQVLKPINGMMCLIDKTKTCVRNKQDHAACLYNVITQEATPWIRSTYLAEVKQWCALSGLTVSRAYEFGFHSTTKEYKVICMWNISGMELPNYQGYGEYIKETIEDDYNVVRYLGNYRMCEILTLGKDTAWRRTDKVPPFDKCYRDICGSVSANGSIYWMVYEDRRPILVVFDVGSEEYRVIPVDLHLIDLGRPGCFRLTELDGHLAIVNKADDHTVNLWILDDDCDKNLSTTNTGNIKWTNEIIRLPPCWNYQYVRRLHVVTGTAYLILQLEFFDRRRRKHVNSVHSYDREKKTFSKIEIAGDESPYSVSANISHVSYTYTRFVESLLTLQRSYRPATEAPHSSSTNTARRLCKCNIRVRHVEASDERRSTKRAKSRSTR